MLTRRNVIFIAVVCELSEMSLFDPSRIRRCNLKKYHSRLNESHHESIVTASHLNGHFLKSLFIKY